MIPIFTSGELIRQDAVRNLRIKKIITTKTNAAVIKPGVPNSSAIPVSGSAVVVGWGEVGGVGDAAAAASVSKALRVASAISMVGDLVGPRTITGVFVGL